MEIFYVVVERVLIGFLTACPCASPDMPSDGGKGMLHPLTLPVINA